MRIEGHLKTRREVARLRAMVEGNTPGWYIRAWLWWHGIRIR